MTESCKELVVEHLNHYYLTFPCPLHTFVELELNILYNMFYINHHANKSLLFDALLDFINQNKMLNKE